MAKRSRGMKSIPPALSQGKNVFPITPIRARLAVSSVGAANNEREVLDLELQFEDNEVMDIWGIEVEYTFDFAAVSAFNDLLARTGLFEDPDKLATTDLSLEATFEEDTSLIWYGQHGIVGGLLTTSGQTIVVPTEKREFWFPQPYTVARNICLIGQFEGTNGNSVVMVQNCTVWGRRRNASDSEFKNIVYRQRF